MELIQGNLGLAFMFSMLSIGILLVLIIKSTNNSKQKKDYKDRFKDEFESLEQLTQMRIKMSQEEKDFLPYSLNESILTKREQVVFRYLQPVAHKHNLIICVKPRMADFITVTLNQYEKGTRFHRYFNKISAKHVDFLLCSVEYMKPVIAIEIDDATHERIETMKRDAFVEAVYHVVRLDIIRLNGYITQEQVETAVDDAMNRKRMGVACELENEINM